MRRVRNILSIEFYLSIFVSLMIVILFENDILLSGEWAADKPCEFTVLSVMELLTIITIPLSLRLFKFKRVNRDLTTSDNREIQLTKWGLIRLSMLCFPMLINTLFYYLFMNVAFGYMGIILFLCLFFIVPTTDRCIEETTLKEE